MTAGGAIAGSQLQRRPPLGAGAGRARRLHSIATGPLAVAIVTAWALVVVAHVTGAVRYVHHDAVPSARPWIGLCVFIVGWLVMVVAMMLPPLALPPSRRPLPRAFLGGFLVVWVSAGLAVLGLDMVVHRAVHGVSALEARPWLVAAALLGASGVVQLAPSTRRQLARCVLPDGVEPLGQVSAFVAGREHGMRCVRADGPLMLVMFAAGGSVLWMALLTAVMVGERSPRGGHNVTRAAGIALLVAAVVVAVQPPSLG
jgi:predicted metal-binding membrane protein